jgi:Ca2+-binding RTX toxin-like protein
MMIKAVRTLRVTLLAVAGATTLLWLSPASASATSAVGLDESGTLFIQSGVDGIDGSNAVSIGLDATRTQFVIVDSAGIFPPEPPLVADSFFQVRAPRSMVARISVGTGTGDDGISAADIAVPLFVDCGAGDDFVIGTEAADLVKGGLGDDTLDGRGGADRRFGGRGNDTMAGEAGDDRMAGDAGQDQMSGGAGVDIMRGLSGRDTMRGGPGNDRMNGGGGADGLFGQGGIDLLNGAAGLDLLNGGAGQGDRATMTRAERRRAKLIERIKIIGAG